jgi:undecaprenyl-diphosphatase
MSDILNVVLRSIIESITEFLPVSSTGHLFLFGKYYPFQNISGGEEFDDLFDIFIQSGAILSVVMIYFVLLKDRISSGLLYALKKGGDIRSYQFLENIVIGCLPIMIFGFIFKKFLDTVKSGEYLLVILSLSWLIGGVMIVIVERFFKTENNPDTNVLNRKKSIFIGLFQCIALIPGVSRSAATILSGRLLGLSRREAAEYSFFLAIPVLFAAGAYKLIKYRAILNMENIPFLAMGFSLSFIFCVLVIRLFLIYIKTHTFEVFGIYRIILGSVVLYLFYLK